ncbi:hypothetical protein BD324DRAFT_620335 [Kockovaella imperatae]|uniref:J domain-containing protein n=1 Tax=Kockovaella imperatae TaxID=4999 RepID=A0A1Y1UJQ8_9TREE|nr:hypothetical protein BD324DRAFT_620335 [Kockovaella imperatae]ORX38300.1 hypothetical protein BD324DRAFT_620335 [Kockovaella imperatae]
MDDTPDPLHQFFPETSSEDASSILYKTLNLPSTATAQDIRSAYRRLALRFHPDKQTSKSDKDKDELAKQFQQVGFAYAVLSDETRRKRYDTSGRTDENAFTDAEEMGWDAYFASLFQRIDRKMLDDDKAKYQGSDDEKVDVEEAYENSGGSLPNILASIPHSSHLDEQRLIDLINNLIDSGKLQSTKKWETTSKDKAARDKRKKKGEKEAKEAEKAARELGVWEEFYGSGEKGKRKGDSNVKQTAGEEGLAALIRKRQTDRAGGLDALAEKYARIEEEERAKKKAKKGGKASTSGTKEMTDEEFAALQAKMFGDKKGKKGAKV